MLMGGKSRLGAPGGEPGRTSGSPILAPDGSPPARQPAVESWTLTAEQVERWLKDANVGDSLIYAHGPSLIEGPAAALVGKLGREGLVHPFPRRIDTRCSDYVVRVLRIRVVSERAPVCDPNMMAVLVELQDDAQAHRRCRSDAALGAATGMTADQIKAQMKKLEASKFIQRRTAPCKSDPRFRVVKVVATGMETAGPGAGR